MTTLVTGGRYLSSWLWFTRTKFSLEFTSTKSQMGPVPIKFLWSIMGNIIIISIQKKHQWANTHNSYKEQWSILQSYTPRTEFWKLKCRINANSTIRCEHRQSCRVTFGRSQLHILTHCKRWTTSKPPPKYLPKLRNLQVQHHSRVQF